jgi:transcriptional regulator with XRE-family HTH domain
MGTFVPNVKSYLGSFVSIGDRLREERERLRLNQTDFAALGGVGRKSQFNYEEGERQPDAAYLAAIANAGVDATYVLTGNRQGQGIGESAVHQAVLDAVDLLSLEKKVDAQQLARAVVKLCAKSASPPPAQPAEGTPQARQVFKSTVGSAVNVEGNLTQTGISFFGDRKNNK